MSILGGALAMGQAQANARMTESVTVGIMVKSETIDESTGQYPQVFESHYAGPNGDHRARVKFPTLTVSERTPGGQTIAVQDVMLSLPVGFSSAVRIDDIVTVTSSTVDPDLVGRTFRIKGDAQSGQVSAHRFPVEAK